MRRGLALLSWSVGLLAAAWTAAPPHVHLHTFTEAVGLVAPGEPGSDAAKDELLPAREHTAASCPACAMGPSSHAGVGAVAELPRPHSAAAVPLAQGAPLSTWRAPTCTARAPPAC